MNKPFCENLQCTDKNESITLCVCCTDEMQMYNFLSFRLKMVKRVNILSNRYNHGTSLLLFIMLKNVLLEL